MTRDELLQAFKEIDKAPMVPDTLLVDQHTWSSMFNYFNPLLDRIHKNPELVTNLGQYRERHQINSWSSHTPAEYIAGHITYAVEFDGARYDIQEEEYREIYEVCYGDTVYDDDFELG